MPRLLNVFAGCVALGSACALYALKYDTRRIEATVQAKEKALEKAEADIAVLKSERAYLGRPERIDKLARQRGLGPLTERQYVRIGEPSDDEIGRLLLDQLAPRRR
jgi:cell division protein FtsL